MKIIDLTMPLDEKTPNFPGDPKIEIKRHTLPKYKVGKTFLSIHSHIATHIDAPSHMIENGKTLSDYPMEKFVGEAVVMDVLGMDKIEADLSTVKEDDIVFFYTDHSRKAYDPDYFQNNPVITKETGKALIEKKIKTVGLDSFTPDNEPYDIHKMFLSNDILIVENLVNLKSVTGRRFQCFILPLKLTHADGAPCRVVGIIT